MRKDSYKVYLGKEDAMQIAVANYIRCQYPKVFWFHCPNGGKRNKIEAAKLKKMGVRRGVPDVLIFQTAFFPDVINIYDHEVIKKVVKSNKYYGLAIELKVKPNNPTKEQWECLEKFEELDFKTAVCYSFDEAQKIIDEYLK